MSWDIGVFLSCDENVCNKVFIYPPSVEEKFGQFLIILRIFYFRNNIIKNKQNIFFFDLFLIHKFQFRVQFGFCIGNKFFLRFFIIRFIIFRLLKKIYSLNIFILRTFFRIRMVENIFKPFILLFLKNLSCKTFVIYPIVFFFSHFFY